MPAAIARRQTWTIIGASPIGPSGLPGRRVDCMRAGMTTTGFNTHPFVDCGFMPHRRGSCRFNHISFELSAKIGFSPTDRSPRGMADVVRGEQDRGGTSGRNDPRDGLRHSRRQAGQADHAGEKRLPDRRRARDRDGRLLARPSPRGRSRSVRCSPRPMSMPARTTPRSAPPAIPSTKAAPTGSAPISTASSAKRSRRARAALISRRR